MLLGLYDLLRNQFVDYAYLEHDVILLYNFVVSNTKIDSVRIMTKRSYQQFCPLAFTLDVIGERWTLLIVRELALGARRFSDIQRGLPSIGPNLLSNRLKDLEQAGVISKIFLPPPAKVMAYILTERGHSLLAATAPLARWGMRYLAEPPARKAFLSPIAMIMGLQVMRIGNETISAEIHLPPDVFSVAIEDSGLQIALGVAYKPDLTFSTSPKMLQALVSHVVPIDEALADERVTLLKGEPAQLQRFVNQFRSMAQLVG